jgi:polyphosphate glucokinase
MVMILTFGTGIGSAIFHDGKLLPNTEFGHMPMPMKGIIVEHYCSDRVRKAEDLKWGEWARRVNNYFEVLELLLSPDVIVVGGGVSKKAEKFLPLLKAQATLVQAELQNDAGIVGAAMAAHDMVRINSE